MITRTKERVRNLQTLRIFELFLLRGFFAHLGTKFLDEFRNIDLLQQILDRFGTHFGDKLIWIVARQFAKTLVRKQIFLLQIRHIAFIDNDIRLKVKDLFQIAKRDVEQVADSRRQPLKKPNVRTRACQLDMAETLASDLRLRDFDAALIADHSAVLHSLVLSAKAFPIGYRAKNTCTKQAIPLRLECSVVNGFGLCNLTMRPRTDLVRRSQADPDRFVISGQCCLAFVIESKHISPI